MAKFLSLAPELGRASIACVAFLGLIAPACQRGPATSAVADVAPSYDSKTGRLERIGYDRNHDSKTDAWLYMDGTRVVRAELDENFDGTWDRWEYYSDQPSAAGSVQGRLPRGVLIRAEQCTNASGKPNRRETYVEGQLATVEEDTTGDGKVDKWETWKNGSVQVIALDTKGTGRPDRRLVYPSDGSGARMEIDVRGDGTFVPAPGDSAAPSPGGTKG
jgi:hypothetical protein